jgi:hypothetical protein
VKKIVLAIFLLVIIVSCGGSKKSIANKNNYLIDKYANILKTPKSEIKNLKLYSFVDVWYNTKYKYGGMSKSGVDCSGFANILYKTVYVKQLPRSTKEIEKVISKVRKGNLEEGDLVFFNIPKKKNAHVGIYLKNNMFVHASTSKGVIISSLDNPYYKKAYNKGGKL